MSVSAYKKTKVASGYSFQLFVNKEKQRLELYCYDEKEQLIDTSIYWSFSTLRRHLYRKMQALAFFLASVSYFSACEFVEFQSISFYVLRDFSFFLSCLKQGKIRVSFKLGYFRNGPRQGEVHDHGVGFELRLSSLEKLYKKILV